MTVALLGVVAALLTGVAILGPAAPALAGRRAFKTAGGEDGDDRRITVLRGLRDLEVDRMRGALSDADYHRLRARLETQAMELLRRSGDADVALELTSAVRASRSARDPRGRGRTAGRAQAVRASRSARVLRGRGRTARRAQEVRAPDRRAWVAGAVIAGVVVAGVSVVLAGAVAARGPGGFITGGTSQGSSSDPHALVAANPNNVEARLELAQWDLENAQLSDATKQYLAVLKLDPKNPEARTRLALLLYESGDSQEALKGVDAVLADDPTWPEALFIKGVVLLNGLNRPADAIAPLQQYLEVDPTGPYSNDARQLLQQAKAS